MKHKLPKYKQDVNGSIVSVLLDNPLLVNSMCIYMNTNTSSEATVGGL